MGGNGLTEAHPPEGSAQPADLLLSRHVLSRFVPSRFVPSPLPLSLSLSKAMRWSHPTRPRTGQVGLLRVAFDRLRLSGGGLG